MMISRISHINSKNALRRVFCGSGVEDGIQTVRGADTPPPQWVPGAPRCSLSVRACGSGQRAAANLGVYSHNIYDSKR